MGLLSGGMAVFVPGDVFFRLVMGMRPISVRFAATAVAVVLGFAGAGWNAQVGLAALAVAVIAVERPLSRNR